MANYYMKFNQDFFDSSEIKLLESLDNGESLVFLYLKLATRAIQFDGYLILNENVGFDIKMIALIFKKDIEFVESAINYYKMFGLIIEKDDILYMEHIARFIGKKDNSKERVAKHRARKKLQDVTVTKSNALQDVTVTKSNALQDVTVTKSNALQDVTVTGSNKKCNDILRDRVRVKEELDKELKLKKDKSKKDIVSEETLVVLDKPKKHRKGETYYFKYYQIWLDFLDLNNNAFGLVRTTKTGFKNMIDEVKKFEKKGLTLTVYQEALQESQDNSFLFGDNNRGWKMDILFLMKKESRAKLYAGKYKGDKQRQSQKSFDNIIQPNYDNVKGAPF